jgi:hypothetical protein
LSRSAGRSQVMCVVIACKDLLAGDLCPPFDTLRCDPRRRHGRRCESFVLRYGAKRSPEDRYAYQAHRTLEKSSPTYVRTARAMIEFARHSFPRGNSDVLGW